MVRLQINYYLFFSYTLFIDSDPTWPIIRYRRLHADRRTSIQLKISDNAVIIMHYYWQFIAVIEYKLFKNYRLAYRRDLMLPIINTNGFVACNCYRVFLHRKRETERPIDCLRRLRIVKKTDIFSSEPCLWHYRRGTI
jgi:hypothetical protein